MKKLVFMSLALLIVLVAKSAAGETTPAEALERVMKCHACAPLAEYPDLAGNIRYDIFDTVNGFVSSMMVNDEALAKQLAECNEKRKFARASATMIPADQRRDKLCAFCSGLFALMERSDVTIQNFDAKLGTVSVATSSTDEGVWAIHQYVEDAKRTAALIDRATAEAKGKKSM